jgi:hypothetical protein
MWVATGLNITGSAYIIIYSYDGINWTLAYTGAGLRGLAWNGKQWMATGQSGLALYAYMSYDGINWYLSGGIVGGGDFSNGISGLAASGTMWVATLTTLSRGYGISLSKDGNNWFYLGNTASQWVNSHYYIGNARDVSWNGTMFVVNCDIGNIYSYDGLLWNLGAGAMSTQPGLSYSHRLNLWFANATTASYSKDGINWFTWYKSDGTAINYFTGVCFNETTHQLYFTTSITQSILNSTIRIGTSAGKYNQGTNAIAIGYNAGTTSQNANSIILNASATALENASLVGTFIQPVRNDASLGQGVTLHYNANEITYGAETSDERVKSNIESANLELCFSTIQALKLRYFAWDHDFLEYYEGNDTHQLGFIAQEVQDHFPKSIYQYSNSFLPDFQALNTDQIYKAHIGATKYLMQIMEAQQSTLDSLVTLLS